MKKFNLMYCLLFVAVGLFAQQNDIVQEKLTNGTAELSMMENPDFTAWYTESFFGLGEQAEGWGIISCKPSQQKTTDAQHGTYAVYLETGYVNLPLIGINNQLLPGTLEGGDAITEAPTSMTFWAKGDILGGDIAMAEVIFRKNGKDAGGGSITMAQADLGNNYKQFSINLSYTGADQPDSLYVTVAGGGGEGSAGFAAGSKLYFDNVEFIYGPSASVMPESWNAGNVGVGSNSSKEFILKNDGKGTLTVSNASSLSAPWTTDFNASSISLGEGQTYPFTITFAPTAEGDFSTSFVITSNGGTKNIPLSGTGFVGDPEIISFTPGNAETDVALNAEVSVTFNMNITSSQLQEITIVPNPGGVVPEIIDNKLIINHNNFSSYTPYIIAIPDGTIDKYEIPVSWSFATGDVINSIPTINKNEVKVYPNPSNGKISVNVSENSTVRVFNLSGKLIETYDNVEGGSVLNLTLPVGAFFVQVESKNGIKINKVIIN